MCLSIYLSAACICSVVSSSQLVTSGVEGGVEHLQLAERHVPPRVWVEGEAGGGLGLAAEGEAGLLGKDETDGDGHLQRHEQHQGHRQGGVAEEGVEEGEAEHVPAEGGEKAVRGARGGAREVRGRCAGGARDGGAREVRAGAEHVLALPVGHEGDGHAIAEKGQQDERHVDKRHE
eukprot:scaffold61893_cov51-Phaeocystis_antarctica.AAC.2